MHATNPHGKKVATMSVRANPRHPNWKDYFKFDSSTSKSVPCWQLAIYHSWEESTDKSCATSELITTSKLQWTTSYNTSYREARTSFQTKNVNARAATLRLLFVSSWRTAAAWWTQILRKCLEKNIYIQHSILLHLYSCVQPFGLTFMVTNKAYNFGFH